MAASIQPRKKQNMTRKPELLFKLDGHTHDIFKALLIPTDEGLIVASDDRYIRIWLKRENGQFWPAYATVLPSPVTSMELNPETRRFFVGCDNGTISEYLASEDYNGLHHKRDYLAHTGRIMEVCFALTTEWVLSCAKDRFFTWHCSETGRRCGGYQLEAAGTALEYDPGSKFVFAGDANGSITILRLSSNRSEVVHALKGHSEAVRSLVWDPVGSRLFSSSSDHSVIAWDIGGGKGTAFELQGHELEVSSIAWCARSQQVISGGLDCLLYFWSMSVTRKETPRWTDSDVCELCQAPFFWNLRRMWEKKTVGVRQHHCRLCGQAVCDKCSPHTTTYPVMGFERAVRVCTDCVDKVTDADKGPLASSYEAKHAVIDMHLDETRKLLVTVGKDRIVKLWDLSSVIS